MERYIIRDAVCSGQPVGRFPAETPLAMAYVPYQSWEKPYEADTALERGTMFPALDLPFKGKGAASK